MVKNLIKAGLVLVIFALLTALAFYLSSTIFSVGVEYSVTLSVVVLIIGLVIIYFLVKTTGKKLNEMKEFMEIVDTWLGKLSTEDAEDFAESDDFKLYEKMMKKYT
jgi:uncharacterized protein YacL